MSTRALLIVVCLAASAVATGWTQQLPAARENPPKQTTTVKPGSKDDVSAIGNRNVGGGKGLGN